MQENLKIPKHIAFIMDGNGRWAKERRLGRTAGHREGIKRVKEIIRGAESLGIETVTFFAFSTENWARPKSEVSILMHYLDNFLDKEVPEMHRNNMRLFVIGRGNPIPAYLQAKISKMMKKTAGNTGLNVVLALNYGGRQEIMDAAMRFAGDALAGKADPRHLSEGRFRSYFYAPDITDPDLLIRTSEEMRVSNFLLWQLSYSEFYFSKKYWPDFGMEELREAVREYQKRERRFGGLDAR
ncbi:MAG: isoprenyl transferase [Candidatus Omnitrophica bacterium]|nr:isoprenyl transferase [Candidatus Omnitrophota bacterium]